MTDERLQPHEFSAICQMIWGEIGWQKPAADYLGVQLRTIQFWAAEPPARGKPVPYDVRATLLAEIARLMAQDRDAIGRMGLWLSRRRAGLDAAIAAWNDAPLEAEDA